MITAGQDQVRLVGLGLYVSQAGCHALGRLAIMCHMDVSEVCDSQYPPARRVRALRQCRGDRTESEDRRPCDADQLTTGQVVWCFAVFHLTI